MALQLLDKMVGHAAMCSFFLLYSATQDSAVSSSLLLLTPRFIYLFFFSVLGLEPAHHLRAELLAPGCFTELHFRQTPFSLAQGQVNYYGTP